MKRALLCLYATELFVVSSAKTKPPVLPGEIKSFSENKTAELDARRMYWRKNNLQV